VDAIANQRPLLYVDDTRLALGRFAASYRRSFNATVIAVTGSVGKTSTREAIFAVLSRRWPGVRSVKNFNNDIGLPLSLLQVEPMHRFAVVELGANRVGEIAYLSGIANPNIGVLTSIGSTHLEGFGSMEGVVRAKSELVRELRSPAVALLNADDARIQAIGQSARCGVLWYGMTEDPHWLFATAKRVTAVGECVTFRLDSGRPVRLSVPGRHQVYAALAAVAVGRWLGMSDHEISAGLDEYRPAAMRCQVERFGQVTVINDAYNASPPSMIAALEMLSSWPVQGRRVLVCGDMLELGEYGAELHKRLGEEIARRPAIAHCVAVGPLCAVTVEAARQAGMSESHIVHCESAAEASDLLGRMVGDGDVVLFKASRGMKLEQVLESLRERWAA
jgi:UDP-N-acetylmuramoyl-tripeptide--D-alanyl-D-alanine ligase